MFASPSFCVSAPIFWLSCSTLLNLMTTNGLAGSRGGGPAGGGRSGEGEGGGRALAEARGGGGCGGASEGGAESACQARAGGAPGGGSWGGGPLSFSAPVRAPLAGRVGVFSK